LASTPRILRAHLAMTFAFDIFSNRSLQHTPITTQTIIFHSLYTLATALDTRADGLQHHFPDRTLDT